jgi:uncharacterized protein (TIRG00374 family)
MYRALKVAISLAFLAALLWWADWSQVLAHVAQIHPAITLFALLAYAGQLFLSAWKWQWSLILHELRLPYGLLSRIYWIAFFLNNLLPTSIGGDAYRVYRTMPSAGFRSRALSAVIVERLIGLGALLALGALGACMLAGEIAVARGFLAVLLTATLGAVAVVAALRSAALRPHLQQLMHYPWLHAVQHNMGLLARARRAYLPLVTLSFLFQSVAIGINYLLFAATGDPVSLAKCAVITAVAGAATVIPFTINGIGVLEGAFAGTAIALGVEYEHALLVAILIRLLVLPLSAIAGLLYALEPATTHVPALRQHAGLVRADHER